MLGSGFTTVYSNYVYVTHLSVSLVRMHIYYTSYIDAWFLVLRLCCRRAACVLASSSASPR